MAGVAAPAVQHARLGELPGVRRGIRRPAEDMRGQRRDARPGRGQPAAQRARAQVPAVLQAQQPQDQVARHRLRQPVHNRPLAGTVG